MRQLTLLLIAMVVMLSCNSKSGEPVHATDFGASSEQMMLEEDLEVAQNEPLAIERKLIKNGSIAIEVRDIKTEKIKVDSLVRRFQAYVDKETTNRYGNKTMLMITIRIPSHHFEKFIAGIENGENKITSKEIKTEDVTEEFIDLELRLLNKRKFMTRYQELLQSAKSIKEMLDIQEKIRALEEEIESTAGRLKYLTHQVSYSTLEVRIEHENEFKYIPEKRENAGEKLKQSLIGGWFVFVDFLYILLYNWVFIILIVAGLYGYLKYRQRKKSK